MFLKIMNTPAIMWPLTSSSNADFLWLNDLKISEIYQDIHFMYARPIQKCGCWYCKACNFRYIRDFEKFAKLHGREI